MKNVSELNVYYRDREVGELLYDNNKQIVFSYTKEWLENGFSISPLSLPLEEKIFVSEWEPFKGIFGVFNDSLPDGWGRLIVDKYLMSKGIDPHSINTLTRLSLVTQNAIGALRYEPTRRVAEEHSSTLDELYNQIVELTLDKSFLQNIDELFIKGSSSNGARPKVSLKTEEGIFLVKFPSSYDSLDSGKMEYDYNNAAKECGIEVPIVRLFESKLTGGFFGSKRFDINKKGEKDLVLSASALLEVSHVLPSLDYRHLFKLSWYLSHSIDELYKLFSVMCFNVFAHNEDDHAKNFSFICDGEKWRLSPLYDLTFSSTRLGEHSTAVNGKGKDITLCDMVNLAASFGLDKEKLTEKGKDIKRIVEERLRKYIK